MKLVLQITRCSADYTLLCRLHIFHFQVQGQRTNPKFKKKKKDIMKINILFPELKNCPFSLSQGELLHKKRQKVMLTRLLLWVTSVVVSQFWYGTHVSTQSFKSTDVYNFVSGIWFDSSVYFPHRRDFSLSTKQQNRDRFKSPR